MLLCDHAAYYAAVKKYVVPMPILADHARKIQDKPEEKQNEMLERWAKEISACYPIRENLLEGRDDLISCMKKIPIMRNVDNLFGEADFVLKEIAEKTEGKSEKEIMRILKRYVAIFEQMAKGIDIEID